MELDFVRWGRLMDNKFIEPLEPCTPWLHDIPNKQVFRGMPSQGFDNGDMFAKIKTSANKENTYQVITSYPSESPDRYYEHSDGENFYGGTVRTEIKFTDRNQHYLLDDNTRGRFNPKTTLNSKGKVCLNFKVRPVNNIFHKDSNRAKAIFQLFPHPHSVTQMNKFDYVINRMID